MTRWSQRRSPTHGAIVRADFKAHVGVKLLMTLTHNGKPVPFGAMVTSGSNQSGISWPITASLPERDAARRQRAGEMGRRRERQLRGQLSPAAGRESAMGAGPAIGRVPFGTHDDEKPLNLFGAVLALVCANALRHGR